MTLSVSVSIASMDQYNHVMLFSAICIFLKIYSDHDALVPENSINPTILHIRVSTFTDLKAT